VLIHAGFAVRTIADANTADEMLVAFGEDEFAGKKLLFVKGELSMRTVPEKLDGIADVDEIAVYRTVEMDPVPSLAEDIRKQIERREIDLACFFSPSAVDAFEKRFGTANLNIATIGETTAARGRQLGFRVELVASRATNEVFSKELIGRLRTDGCSCFIKDRH
jgi:uroporphyrinogen-III synthase